MTCALGLRPLSRVLLFAVVLAPLALPGPLAVRAAGGEAASAASDGAEPTAGEGLALYQEHCAACHGPEGKGDGTLAASLPVAPADLTQLAALNDGVFPRDRLVQLIHGYPGEAHAGVMPDFGRRLGGPKVPYEMEDGGRLPATAELVDLVDYLASIQES